MTPDVCQNRRLDLKTGVTKTKVLPDCKFMIEITSKIPSAQMKDLKNKPREDLERLAAGLGVSASVQYKEIKTKG